ncbi:MAG: hypothetical protein COV67_05575 [Nitrospinae bacterium CG11_big_fil_rev_8_21_14_0_20_56_8]|nr:MAG: hypothetical protein COV67_05575 [Nitrospinae bacterium CG11_big_fil_rev_8_21_14_0_20_56_8]
MELNATSGISQQLQAAVTKTALDVQKQEGNNALDLIQSAVETGQNAAPTPQGNTGHSIDITV